MVKKFFNEDGQISTETDYKDGNKHGKESYYEDGQKWWNQTSKGWKNGKEINYEVWPDKP